ncbi:Nhr-46 [Aphelenchoides besseyi]|nr:Nhr-46 [Aphelenchoides besseyi]
MMYDQDTREWESMPSDFVNESQYEERGNNRCVVCGVLGASKHYDALCCSSGRCNVDLANRNQCRACRLQRCLSGGLNPDLVTDGKFRHEIPDDPKSRAVASRYNTSTVFTRMYNLYAAVNRGKVLQKDSILLKHQRLNSPNNNPLGTRRLVPFFDIHDLASITNYYCKVDKFVDIYFDHEYSYVIKADKRHRFNMNVNMHEAFFLPNLMSARAKMNWDPEYLVPENFAANYARLTVLYTDFASHVIGNGSTFMPVVDIENSETINKYGQIAACSRWAYDEIVLSSDELNVSQEEFALLKALCVATPGTTETNVNVQWSRNIRYIHVRVSYQP